MIDESSSEESDESSDGEWQEDEDGQWKPAKQIEEQSRPDGPTVRLHVPQTKLRCRPSRRTGIVMF